MFISKPKKIFLSLFPVIPRDFPFRRSMRTFLRTIHIFTSGVLLGGLIFNQPMAILEPWLFGAVISGLLLMATDLHASFAVLCELRGLAVIVKIILLILVPVFWEARVQLLIAALVIGSVSSHMPKRYRHKILLFQNHIVPDQRGG